MKRQRIIFTLEDGRRKYATHRGVIEKWDWQEVELLLHNARTGIYRYEVYNQLI